MVCLHSVKLYFVECLCRVKEGKVLSSGGIGPRLRLMIRMGRVPCGLKDDMQ